MGKDKQKPSTGRTLGGAPAAAASSGGSSSGVDMYYTVTFSEEKIGMAVVSTSGPLSFSAVDASVKVLPVVSTVVLSSPASKAGVLVGDVVIGLEGNNLTCFEDFESFFTAIGRPISVNFARKGTAVKAAAAASSSSSGEKKLFSFGKTPDPPPLTAEEQAARREQAAQAALERTKQWDTKLAANKAKRTGGNNKKGDASLMPEPLKNLESESATSEATRRAIELAKNTEHKQTAATGFSPFTPHMSFRSSSAPTSCGDSGDAAGEHLMSRGASDGSSSSGVGASSDCYNVPDSVAEEMADEVDAALGLLLSLGSNEETEAAAEVAMTTVYKMMCSLNNNKQEAKLRSIRVGNPAFQKKVVSVPGSVEMLECAGFVKTMMQKPDAPSDDPKELFLVHDMDAVGLVRLQYTIDRMNDLNLSESATPK